MRASPARTSVVLEASAPTPQNNGSLIDNTFSYIDNLTWQRGKHTLSFGIQALRYQNNYPTSNNNGYLGTLTYSGDFTKNPDPAVTDGNGFGGADFLLDRVQAATATLSSINVGQRQWRTAGLCERRLQSSS